MEQRFRASRTTTENDQRYRDTVRGRKNELAEIWEKMEVRSRQNSNSDPWPEGYEISLLVNFSIGLSDDACKYLRRKENLEESLV